MVLKTGMPKLLKTRRCILKWPNTNFSKPLKKVRGMILQSNLYSRAQSFVPSTGNDKLPSNDCTKPILSVLYMRDWLTVFSTGYTGVKNLINCRRGYKESFSNYETGFASLISEFNAQGHSMHLTESISAFMLMSSATKIGKYGVFILAAAAKNLMVTRKTRPKKVRHAGEILPSSEMSRWGSCINLAGMRKTKKHSLYSI